MSFIVVNAWSGVLERMRRVHVVSALVPSKVISAGYGVVRFRYVYIPRRYRSGPVLVGQGNAPYARSEISGGCGGKTLGPPTRSFIRPDADSAMSRMISPSTRSRGARASRMFAGSFSSSFGVTTEL